jgi:hypothetical protein
MGRRVMCIGEADYFRDYKRLGAIAKLATRYLLKEAVTANSLLLALHGSFSSLRPIR